MTSTTADPATLAGRIAELDPRNVVDGYRRAGLDAVDDTTLLSAVAAVVGVPKAAAPDSFVLHAPLEVLARAGLLQHCSPGARETARQRLVWMAATYAASGPAVRPAQASEPSSITDATRRLTASISAGELDDAEVAGRWLGATVDPVDLASVVGDAVIGSLAAAAHGAIFLQQLPRSGAQSAAARAMFGNLARELAREPDWQLRWIDQATPTDDARSLGDALAEMPPLADPGPDNFIYPLMSQAERTGLAPDTVGPALGGDPAASARELVRVSTESMLLDNPDRAPYGWSHCLTLPLAVVAIAPRLRDRRRALAVAGTYVTGFRGALGDDSLTSLRQRARPEPEATFALDLDPDVAAETLAGLDGSERLDAVRSVVDYAAAHPDAHLAKYTVACLEAARFDQAAAPQHLGAAAKLAAWWHQLPVEDDPLLS